MLITLAVTTGAAFLLGSILLFAAGHRLKVRSSAVALLVGLLTVLAAGELVNRIWHPPAMYVVGAQVLTMVMCTAVILLRSDWNPIGQVFFGTFLSAGVSYLAFSGYVTFEAPLGPAGRVASLALLLLEGLALVVAASYAFENCDVVARSKWPVTPEPELPAHWPMVSLHVPAYNEPPEMLIETIQSLEKLNYPNFEIVVIDNNTQDEAVWRPVESYCRGRQALKFVHVAPWPGFKSGALNLALKEHTDPAAEVIAVVDADYIVDAGFLRKLVPHVLQQGVAFAQAPQDYIGYEGDAYLTGCYDAYRYFFESSMRSRNLRGSAIFVGTMGVIRRDVLESVGGWDEWCITEDAELSVRLMKAGYRGVFVNNSLGRGIMPLTFPGLKRQMFRWCFGAMQILRKHGRSLLPWSRRTNLSLSQRLDQLLLYLQWFNSLLSVGFAVVLTSAGVALLVTGRSQLRPLVGAAMVLPAIFIGNGLLRAVWTLRHALGIGLKRSLMTFAVWLSLTWVIAQACVSGIIRAQGVFLRTSKWKGDTSLLEAVRETKVETSLALALWAVGTSALIRGAGPLLVGVAMWQGAVFAAAPWMAWLNLHSELPARLERARRWESRRDRVTLYRPHLFSGAAAVVVAGILVLAFAGGGGPTRPGEDLFDIPNVEGDQSPLGGLADLIVDDGSVEETVERVISPTSSPAGPGGPLPPPAAEVAPGPGFETRPAPAPAPSPAAGAPTSPQPATSPGPPQSQPGASPGPPESPPAPTPSRPAPSPPAGRP